MNDFEWLREARGLNQAEAPQRDVWPRIVEAIAAQPVPQRREHARWPLALAATLVLTFMAGFAAWHLHGQTNPGGTDIASATLKPLWQPQDPRLLAAAADLDAARVELVQALEVTPEAAYLKRLLARTAGTRERLHNLEQSAG